MSTWRGCKWFWGARPSDWFTCPLVGVTRGIWGLLSKSYHWWCGMARRWHVSWLSPYTYTKLKKSDLIAWACPLWNLNCKRLRCTILCLMQTINMNRALLSLVQICNRGQAMIKLPVMWCFRTLQYHHLRLVHLKNASIITIHDCFCFV